VVEIEDADGRANASFIMARNNRNKKTIVVQTARRSQPQQRRRVGQRAVIVNPVAGTVRRRNQGRGTVSRIASTVGELVGFPRVGRMIGNGLQRIMGSGAYVISNPVKSNTLASNTPPMFGNDSGSTRVRHREFVSDISGSLAFVNTAYALNPGNISLFPWLATMAQNYEQYHFHGLCIEFKSTSASALNSTNTALGVVGLVTQYDAVDPAFASKMEAENYQGAQSSSPSNSVLHFVECAPRQNVLDRLYVRSAAATLPAGQDLRFYDMGKVNLFTAGMQAAAVIGELWISYDIEFYKPKVPTGGAAGLTLLDSFHALTVPSSASMFPSPSIVPTYNKLDTRLVNPASIYVPAAAPSGTYLFVGRWVNFSALSPGSGISSVTVTGGVNDNIFSSSTLGPGYNSYVSLLGNGAQIFLVAFTHTFGTETTAVMNGPATGASGAVAIDGYVIALPPDFVLMIKNAQNTKEKQLFDMLPGLLSRLGVEFTQPQTIPDEEEKANILSYEE
jgi:hypothetical protein